MNELFTDLNTVKVRKENNGKLSSDEFRRLQLVELELLKEVDRVCRKNGIRYSICAGTLLGAVRHKGFIPWDDDADVAMLRKDYEAFKRVSDQLNSDICFFQDHETDPEYLWGYGKIRKTGTCHIRSGQEHIECQNGVYIDIFPLDDIPKSIPGQIVQDFKCYIFRKILWSKVGKRTEHGLFRLWYLLLSNISTEWVYDRLESIIGKSNNSTDNRVRTLLFPSFGKLYIKNSISERYGMPKQWFLELADYEFEGYMLLGTKDYDNNLRYIYDDYMIPPSPEKRIPKVSFSRIEY